MRMEKRKNRGDPVRAILFKPEFSEFLEIEIFNDETLLGVFSTSEKGALSRDSEGSTGLFECLKIQSGLNCITDADAFLCCPAYVTVILNSCGKSFVLKERIIFIGEVVDHKFTSLEMSIKELAAMIESVTLQ
jgi:hypothetical protein